MTYRQKITQIGNSLGIVIPKELRDALNLSLGKEVIVKRSVDSGQLIISTKEVRIDPNFYSLLEEVDEQYSDALDELAKK